MDGFLGTRASLMMDVVFLAMFLVLPIMAVSVLLVRFRRRYVLHRRLQLGLAIVLLAAVVLFEVDVRLQGWQHRAVQSPYFAAVEQPGPIARSFYTDLLRRQQVPGALFTVLGIHLVFAITTPVLWTYVIVTAMRKFPNPPRPTAHSRSHIFWGRLAVADMTLTGITGCVFYWMAFVA